MSTNKKRGGLGGGLGSVLGPIITANETDIKQEVSANEILISDIEPNPWQPRDTFDQEKLEELAASIKAVGVITPITLRQKDNGKYQIIAGERRFRASQIAGLTSVPAYVRQVDDDKMLQLALIENIQRENLDPIEEAISYKRLMEECNLTQEQLAEQVGKSRSAVANSLRLLNLPAEIQDGLRKRKITQGHARAIMGIDDEATQIMLFQQTVEYGYSVRRIEELVREYNEKNDEQPKNDTAKKKKTKAKSAEYKELKQRLSDLFKSDVKFSRNENGSGKITIKFESDDELESIMAILDKAK